MALSRYNATTGLLGGNLHKENADGLLGKPGLAKTRLAQRSALGNISNAAKPGLIESKKGLKETTNLQKPVKPVGKAPPTEKENSGTLLPVHLKQEHIKVDPASPCVDPVLQAFSKQLLQVQDIDKDDHQNPQLVSEYVNNIYDYMRQLERDFPIQTRYLDGSDLTGRMRGILVDWLVQVHLRFHLLQETLYLAIAIIDRFLQTQKVARSKLQLVGVTAMLIASKYEEMYAPEIMDFVYITDNAYTKADIRKTEIIILKALGFNLGRPLPLHFLRRNSKAGEVDATKHTLAKYVMELTTPEYDMVHLPPSEIASSALCLAMKVLDDTEWNDTLQFYSKYGESDLMPIMEHMAYLVTKAGTGKLTAVKTKYQSSKFMRISLIPELKSQLIQDLAATYSARIAK